MAIYTILNNIDNPYNFELEEISESDLDAIYFNQEIKNQGDKIKNLFCAREAYPEPITNIFLNYN